MLTILHRPDQKGITLIELMLLLAIFSVMTSIILVITFPSFRSEKSKNVQRLEDVNTILNSIYQYSIDNNGKIPEAITTKPKEICRTNGNCKGLTDLSVLTTDEKYLISIPIDPGGGSENGSGYIIFREDSRVTVSALTTDNSVTISVTR